MKTNIIALKIFGTLAVQPQIQILILSVLATVVAILTNNLVPPEKVHLASLIIEMVAMQSAQFIMPRSFLLGFLTIYSISQYLLHLVFTFLPISFQDTYLNFGLLAVSYFIIKGLREKRSREIEKFEMQYLSGNECNASLLLITLGGSLLAMFYQMSLGYVLGNAGLVGLSRYAALVMGSYLGYCLNETQLVQYSSISTNQRLSQIIITFIGQVILACTFSQYTLALIAIYYSTGLTINYLKEKEDLLTEIDHMYYYKLI